LLARSNDTATGKFQQSSIVGIFFDVNIVKRKPNLHSFCGQRRVKRELACIDLYREALAHDAVIDTIVGFVSYCTAKNI
jgi:hypothetical protein